MFASILGKGPFTRLQVLYIHFPAIPLVGFHRYGLKEVVGKLELARHDLYMWFV